ncbi:MAG TPA: PRC-barrel domain-containing protein [Mycobacteriales bacterium]|nr:PRC-barrel domain-containing protein [Mycobacteriales bacterium]
MRASDLLGREVLDRDGIRLGVVTDLRCVLDGPLRGGLCAPRVEALLVSRHRTGSLLGYDRNEQQGPWLLRVLVRLLHRRLTVVPWTVVETSQAGPLARPLALRVAAADLPAAEGRRTPG